MHDCLRIPEIFCLICDKVDENSGHRAERNSQLLALALTCRDFQEPALAKLWETIHHIGPITPRRSIGREIGLAARRNFPELGRLLLFISASTDVHIVRKYAHLVRHIVRCDHHCRWCSEGWPAADVWNALRSAFSGTLLFSNLQTFYCPDRDMLESFALIGVRSLNSFAIRFFDVTQSLVNFSTRSPGITSFRLLESDENFSKKDPMDTLLCVNAMLSNWRQLSLFESNYITFGVLKTLCDHSNNLRYLRVQIFLYTQPEKTDALIFDRLGTMDIGFTELSHAVGVVGSLAATTSLHTMIVYHHFSTHTLEWHWLALLRSLEKQSRSMKKLAIRELVHRKMNENVHSVTARATPLTSVVLFTLADSFLALSHIEFIVLAGYDIDDEDMKRLTKAVPQVEEFCLYNDPEIARYHKPRHPEPKLTLRCLQHFAKNCKLLSHLALDFDMGELTPGTDTKEAEEIDVEEFEDVEAMEPGLNMKWLDVCFSQPKGRPRLIATFLSRLFPNLQRLDYGWHPDLSVWSEVRGILGIKTNGGRM